MINRSPPSCNNIDYISKDHIFFEKVILEFSVKKQILFNTCVMDNFRLLWDLQKFISDPVLIS
jgi:hypothetical protein